MMDGKMMECSKGMMCDRDMEMEGMDKERLRIVGSDDARRAGD